MTYDFTPAVLDPKEPAAWCFTCDGLRHYSVPAPGIETRVIPVTVAGKPVGEQIITLRRGRCRECGDEILRVGGGRGGEA